MVPAVVMLTLAGLVYRGSSQAFGDLDGTGSAAASGSALVVTDVSGRPLTGSPLDLRGLLPGASGTRCVKVTYTGGPAVVLRLYGTDRTVSGQFDRWLRLRVTAGPTGRPGCPAAMAGAIVFDGSFDRFPTDPAIAGWSRWLDGRSRESVVFAITYRLSAGAPSSVAGARAGMGLAWNIAQAG